MCTAHGQLGDLPVSMPPCVLQPVCINVVSRTVHLYFLGLFTPAGASAVPAAWLGWLLGSGLAGPSLFTSYPSPPTPSPHNPHPPTQPHHRRRFGIAGGLAWLGFLAVGTLGEQVKTRMEVAAEREGARDVEGAQVGDWAAACAMLTIASAAARPPSNYHSPLPPHPPKHDSSAGGNPPQRRALR